MPASRSSAMRRSTRRTPTSPSSPPGRSAFPASEGSARVPPTPAITTYIDGVPQLNTNSSSIEFHGRSSRWSSCVGRRARCSAATRSGGLVSVTSGRPSLTAWTGSASVPVRKFRGARSARPASRGRWPRRWPSAFALGRQRSRRLYDERPDGQRHRSSVRASSARLRCCGRPASNWEARAIVSGERARDGDLALNDLEALRRNPFHAGARLRGKQRSRHRVDDGAGAAGGAAVSRSSSTTGFVSWKTRAVTDLDYTPLPLVTRDNAEEGYAVHPGSAAGLGSQRARQAVGGGAAAEMAGGSVLLHAELRSGRDQHLCAPASFRRSCVSR